MEGYIWKKLEEDWILSEHIMQNYQRCNEKMKKVIWSNIQTCYMDNNKSQESVHDGTICIKADNAGNVDFVN